ncbi:hypothetical protein G7046_g7968 [Stylonectria norvegica]|nr:hypothetical protein G7046_g7968 [Stylonectria norvegica]
MSTHDPQTQTFTLPDGRKLGYAEYGDHRGTPLLYFHGYPSSRLEASVIDTMAQRLNVRVISLDRPGFGLSTPQPNRRILDWPTDVSAFAKGMQLSRFAVMGLSGGGPYALACAHSLPQENLQGVGLFASGGPWVAGAHHNELYRRVAKFLAIYWPSALGATLSVLVRLTRWLVNTGPVARRIDGWLEQQDKEKKDKVGDGDVSDESEPQTTPTRTTAERRLDLVRMLLDEPFAQGSKAAVDEARLLSSNDWGFSFESVRYSPAEECSLIRYLATVAPAAPIVQTLPEALQDQDGIFGFRMAKLSSITHEEVATHYDDILEALHHIHSAGVVHFDLSWTNTMLDHNGHVTFIDPGHAGLSEEDVPLHKQIKSPQRSHMKKYWACYDTEVLDQLRRTIESIKALSHTIANIKDAPEALRSVCDDLDALYSTLRPLEAVSQGDGVSELSPSMDVLIVIINCGASCQRFQDSLDRWVWRLAQDQAVWTDGWSANCRWDSAFLGLGQVESLKAQLRYCREALGVIRLTSNFLSLSRREYITKDMRSKILRQLEGSLLTKTFLATREKEILERQMKEHSSVEEDNEGGVKLLRGFLQQQASSNRVYVKTCEEALKKAQFERAGKKARILSELSYGVKIQHYRRLGRIGHSSWLTLQRRGVHPKTCIPSLDATSADQPASGRDNPPRAEDAKLHVGSRPLDWLLGTVQAELR